MIRVPAGAVAALGRLALRDAADALEADVAVDIGEDEVERRAQPRPAGFAKLGAVLRLAHVDGRRQPAARFEAEPADRDRPRRPKLRRHDLVDNRPVARRADRLPDRLLAAHLDLLNTQRRRLPFAVVEEAIRMGGIGLLLIEITLGADVVGDAPGDAFIAADHHA